MLRCRPSLRLCQPRLDARFTVLFERTPISFATFLPKVHQVSSSGSDVSANNSKNAGPRGVLVAEIRLSVASLQAGVQRRGQETPTSRAGQAPSGRHLLRRSTRSSCAAARSGRRPRRYPEGLLRGRANVSWYVRRRFSQQPPMSWPDQHLKSKASTAGRHGMRSRDAATEPQRQR